jgi:hypothetical protein
MEDRRPGRGTLGWMQVTAIATSNSPDWRWRIVNYAGEVIEESRDVFPSIATAVARGTKRLVEMNLVERSKPPRIRQARRRGV